MTARWLVRLVQLLAVLFVGAALPLTPASADPLPPCSPDIPIELQAPCDPPPLVPPIQCPCVPPPEPPCDPLLPPPWGCLPGEEAPSPPPAAPAPPPSDSSPDSSSGTASGSGLIGAAGITDARGNPVDRFDTFADPGAWDQLGRKINMWVTNFLFGIAATIVTFLAWLTGFSLEWPYLGVLGEQAQAIEDVFRTDLIPGVDLRLIMLTFAGAWCMWKFVRGRTGQSFGEGAVSLVISALAVTVLAYPVQLIFGEDGLLTQTRDGGLEVSSLALSGGEESSTDPDQVIVPLQQSLVDALIAQPHQLINFGEPIPPGHPCYAVWEDIVAGGPWADADSDVEDQPREAMRDQCGADGERLAAYNEDPTGERLLAAFLFLLAVLVLSVPWILCAFAAGLAPFLLLFEAALFLIAMIVAILPGDSRAFFYKRIGGVISTLAGVVAALLIMTVFVLVIAGTLSADTGLPLIARFLIIDGIAIAGLIFRKRITARLKAVGQKVTAKLSSSRLGGTTSGAPVPAAGASQLGSYSRSLARVGGQMYAGRQIAKRLAPQGGQPALGGAPGSPGVPAGVGAAAGVAPGGVAAGTAAAAVPGAPGAAAAVVPGGAIGAAAAVQPRVGPSGLDRLTARLDRSRSGRTVHRAAALGTGVSKAALKYSVGAPVYVPRKVIAVGQQFAGANAQVRGWLGQQKAQAGDFAAEYRHNVGRMVPSTVHMAVGEVRARSATPTIPTGGARQSREGAHRRGAAETVTTAAAPAAQETTHRAPAPAAAVVAQPAAPEDSASHLLGRLNHAR